MIVYVSNIIEDACNYELLYTSVPGPVRNATVELREGADNMTAVLSWQPPDESNGVITQYQVLYAGYNGTQVYIVVIATIILLTSHLLLCSCMKLSGVLLMYHGYVWLD